MNYTANPTDIIPLLATMTPYCLDAEDERSRFCGARGIKLLPPSLLPHLLRRRYPVQFVALVFLAGDPSTER